MTTQQDNCRYAKICQWRSSDCSEGFVRCKQFSIYANREYARMKAEQEARREYELYDIGLVRVLK